LVRVATYRFRKVAQDAGTRGFLFDWGMVALMMSDSAARISVLILSRSSFHAPPARLGGRPRAAAALSVRFAVSSAVTTQSVLGFSRVFTALTSAASSALTAVLDRWSARLLATLLSLALRRAAQRSDVPCGERPLTGTGPTHSTNSRSVTVPSAHIGDSFRIAST
jgi:hypothetical protein